MNAVSQTLRLHASIVRRYPFAALLVFATFAPVLYYGWIGHRMAQAIGYLSAVWLGAFLTDLVVTLRPRSAVGFPIRRPVSREIAVIFACTALAGLFLAIRFSPLWPNLHGPARVAVGSLVFFAYPIVLALVCLFVFRYRPSQLGINAHYWYLPLLLHLLIGGITLVVAPGKPHWRATFAQMGFANTLFTGIVCAALSEEFLRMLLQTRLGAAFRNKGLGFFFATFVWAALHLPVTAQGSPQAFRHLLLGGMWTIMPIGFLWGYLTHRTKSLLPAVLLHGLNLWGLQNM